MNGSFINLTLLHGHDVGFIAVESRISPVKNARPFICAFTFPLLLPGSIPTVHSATTSATNADATARVPLPILIPILQYSNIAPLGIPIPWDCAYYFSRESRASDIPFYPSFHVFRVT